MPGRAPNPAGSRVVTKKRVKAGGSQSAAEHKRKLFVEAYCTNGGNGKQAAITAGFAPRSAEVTASRLLRHAKVSAAVQQRRGEAFAHAQRTTLLTAEEVLEDLAQAKRFDPAKLYAADGSLLPVRDMPEEVRLQLEGVEVDEIAVGKGEDRTVIGQTSKVKFPKKSVVRDQAMKHFGLYKADNEQKPAPAIHLPGVKSVKFEPLSGRGKRAA